VLGDGNEVMMAIGYDDGDVGADDDSDGDGDGDVDGGCLGFRISETSIFSYCRLRSDPRSLSDG
jgi:hypothetical protein